MFHLISTLFAGLFALALVVIIHELAHFLVARSFGITTECFSVGFGPTLWSRKAADGTVYRLALIPLGGYIKMKGEHANLGERSQLPADAYFSKPIWQRMLVVLAGPFSNFVLAFLLFWALLFAGSHGIKPVVGQVRQGSIAAKAGLRAGDQFLQVGGEKSDDWRKVVLRLMTYLGERGYLNVQVLRSAATSSQQLSLQHSAQHSGQHVTQLSLHFDLADWNNDDLRPQPLMSLGIKPYRPAIPLKIDRILPDSPAAHAGLHVGDRLLEINGKAIKNWIHLQKTIAPFANQNIKLTVMRKGRKETLPVRVGAMGPDGKKVGVLGIKSFAKPWPKSMLVHKRYGPLQQIAAAGSEVWFYFMLNAKILWRLLIGRVSVHSLGGPIMVFQSAGAAMAAGWQIYIHLLALISLIVGFFNVLPIPLVDGGVFVFQVVEWIRGKPAPLWVQNIYTVTGFSLLIYLFIQATLNDLLRFF